MRSPALFSWLSAGLSIPSTMVRRIPLTIYRVFRSRERFRIMAMDRIAPRVVRIRFSPESGHLRPYRAGQFLFVRFDIPGLPQRTKSFTISNPPGESFIEILIKGTDDWTLALYDRAESFPGPQNKPSGHQNRQPGRQGSHPGFQGSHPGPEGQTSVSPWLAWLDYPYGAFTTEGAGAGPWVFLAAGIGIVPFLAMAGDRLRDDTRVLILWAAHNRDELAGFEQLSAINTRKPSIRMVPVLAHDPLWTGRQGHLDKQTLLDLAAAELADQRTCYWICCPAPLRRSLVTALKSLGVPGKHIRCEEFF